MAAACGGPGQQTPSSTIPAEYRTGHSALDGADALAALYPDTTLAVVAASPRVIDQKLGWNSLLALADASLPAALADPDRWAEIGVAADQRFGVALIDPGNQTWAWFATLADPAAFARYLTRAAHRNGVELDISDAGHGTLYLPRGDSHRAVVVRDRVAFYLVTAGAKSVRDLTAVRLASTARADSLAGAAGFADLRRHLGFGHDLAAYLAVDRWLAPALAPTEVDDKLAEAAARLDAALKQKPGDPDQTARLRQQRRLVAAMQRSRNGQRRLIALVADLGAIGIGVELDTTAARLAVLARPDPRSLAFRLLSGPAAHHPIAAAAPAAPWLLAALHTRPADLIALGDLLVASRATSVGELADQLDRATGTDTGRRLLDQLDGELGVLVGAPAGTGANSPGELTALFGVRDPRATAAALSDLAAAGATSGAIASDRSGRLLLPYGTRQLHLGTAGSALVAATDPAAFARLATPTPERSDYPTGLAALFEPATTGLLLVGGRILADLLAEPPVTAAPTAMDVVSEVAESPATRALHDRYQKLTEKVGKRLQEIADDDARLAEHRADLLGTLALAVVTSDDDELFAFGGQFAAGPLVAVASDLAETTRDHRARRTELLAALRQLEAERSRLADQLAAQRQRDIEAAKAAPSTPAPPPAGTPSKP